MMKLLISISLLILSAVAVFAQKDEVRMFGTSADVPRISTEEAKKGFDEASVVFVDARAPEAYAAEHIKGAVIIKGAAADRFDALRKGKTVIVYCSCSSEQSSSRLAFQMNQEGIANVYALKGGIQDWKAAKYPTDQSK